MKKTLIALVVLSGLAMADDFANLPGVEYRDGYDYTLTLTLNATSFNDSQYILKTAENVHLFTQLGNWVGVEKDGNGVLSSSDANNKYGQELITVTAGESEFWFLKLCDNTNNNSAGLTLHFESEIETDTTKITITKPTGNGAFTTPIVLNVNTVIDPSQIQYNTSKISELDVKYTPEPATATLSLLALAGLAARHKRH